MRILYNDGDGLCTSEITDALNYTVNVYAGVLFVVVDSVADGIFIDVDIETANSIIREVYTKGTVDISNYEMLRCDDEGDVYDPKEVY